jgi:hypothetical protein
MSWGEAGATLAVRAIMGISPASPRYLSVFEQDPAVSQQETAALPSGWARPSISFLPVTTSNGTISTSNSGTVIVGGFTISAAITHVGVYETETKGTLTLVAHAPLGSTRSVSAGDTINFAVSSLYFRQPYS